MEFQDDAWVKLAALYWNKLGRIVPRDSPPPLDSPTVRQLIDELGFVKNLYPTVGDMAVVSNMFLEVLDKHEKVLVKRYGLKLKSINIPPLDIEAYHRHEISMRAGKMRGKLRKEFERSQLLRPLSDEDIARYTAQYERAVRGYFRAPGESKKVSYASRVLSTQTTQALEDRVVIHPKLAFTYMQVLAEQMASNRQLHPITDDIFSHIAISGYTVERLTQVLLSEDLQPHLVASSPGSDEIEVQMATIALQSVLPLNLTNIPTSQIIKLRNQYSDEMTAFQDYLQTLAEDLRQLQGVQDLEALQAHLEIAYERKIKPQLSDLKKCLSSLGISTVDGVMNIQVALPPLLASAITSAGAYFHLAPVNPIVIGAGALAFSVFPVIRKKQEEAKQLIRSSPAAYLLYVQEHLEPAQITSKTTRLARHMFFRV
jgi:hypothetical protein